MAAAAQTQGTAQKVDFSFENVVTNVVVFVARLLIMSVVIMFLWNWFVPEIFASGPKLNLWEALGIRLLVTTLTLHAMDRTPNKLSARDRLFVSLGLATLFLSLGYIVHLLMG